MIIYLENFNFYEKSDRYNYPFIGKITDWKVMKESPTCDWASIVEWSGEFDWKKGRSKGGSYSENGYKVDCKAGDCLYIGQKDTRYGSICRRWAVVQDDGTLKQVTKHRLFKKWNKRNEDIKNRFEILDIKPSLVNRNFGKTDINEKTNRFDLIDIDEDKKTA